MKAKYQLPSVEVIILQSEGNILDGSVGSVSGPTAVTGWNNDSEDTREAW